MAITTKNLSWTAETEQEWILLTYGSQVETNMITGNGDTRGIEVYVESCSEGEETIGYIHFYCEAGRKYNKEIIVSRAICGEKECNCDSLKIIEIN